MVRATPAKATTTTRAKPAKFAITKPSLWRHNEMEEVGLNGSEQVLGHSVNAMTGGWITLLATST